MIGFLRGILLEKEDSNLIIEVNGVGYEIQIALSNLITLLPIGKELSLYIHSVSREDGEFLYGFTDKEQRSLFRSLIKVNNIGPKIALAILSAMEPKIFAKYIYDNNIDALKNIPGIGAKTAKRLMIEMRDKIDNSNISFNNTSIDSPIGTAINALVALGYKPYEARQALNNLKNLDLSSEELIRQALKKIEPYD
jgi:Holliday junction DNA helicase RuvA